LVLLLVLGADFLALALLVVLLLFSSYVSLLCVCCYCGYQVIVFSVSSAVWLL
jgi:hypothetical protein